MFIGLGLGLTRIAQGGGAPAVPVALTLTWDTPTTDDTPSFTVTIANPTDADVVTFQYSTLSDFSDVGTSDGTTSVEPINEQVTFTLAHVDNGSYYARAHLVQDGVDMGYSSTVPFTIAVPALSAPTDITLSVNSTPETTSITPVGAVVATISDNGWPVSEYTLTADPDNKFSIVGDELRVAHTLDYETKTSHSITISADNGVGSPFSKTFTINVTDVDESAIPWTPASLFAAGELGAWYDPSDMSTLFQDSAGTTPVTAADQPVGKILDKSGNGNHLTQSSSSSRPMLHQSGGLWYLEFDGSDDVLFGASSAFGATISDATVIVGNREIVRKASSLFSLTGSGSDRWQAHAPFSDGTIYFDVAGSSGANRVSVADPLAAGVDNVLAFKCSVTDNVQVIRQNGAQIAADATGHSVPSPAGIRLGADTSGNFANTRVYGFVAVATATLIADIEEAEAYLAGKSGVTL